MRILLELLAFENNQWTQHDIEVVSLTILKSRANILVTISENDIIHQYDLRSFLGVFNAATTLLVKDFIAGYTNILPLHLANVKTYSKRKYITYSNLFDLDFNVDRVNQRNYELDSQGNKLPDILITDKKFSDIPIQDHLLSKLFLVNGKVHVPTFVPEQNGLLISNVDWSLDNKLMSYLSVIDFGAVGGFTLVPISSLVSTQLKSSSISTSFKITLPNVLKAKPFLIINGFIKPLSSVTISDSKSISFTLDHQQIVEELIYRPINPQSYLNTTGSDNLAYDLSTLNPLTYLQQNSYVVLLNNTDNIAYTETVLQTNHNLSDGSEYNYYSNQPFNSPIVFHHDGLVADYRYDKTNKKNLYLLNVSKNWFDKSLLSTLDLSKVTTIVPCFAKDFSRNPSIRLLEAYCL